MARPGRPAGSAWQARSSDVHGAGPGAAGSAGGLRLTVGRARRRWQSGGRRQTCTVPGPRRRAQSSDSARTVPGGGLCSTCTLTCRPGRRARTDAHCARAGPARRRARRQHMHCGGQVGSDSRSRCWPVARRTRTQASRGGALPGCARLHLISKLGGYYIRFKHLSCIIHIKTPSGTLHYYDIIVLV